MADTKKPSLSVREFALWQLERIAADALTKAPKCVTGRRVDIERLMQEGFDIELIAFHELTRRWKTYAFIDTTAKKVFVDADLMDNLAQAKKYRFTLGEELSFLAITVATAGTSPEKAVAASLSALGRGCLNFSLTIASLTV